MFFIFFNTLNYIFIYVVLLKKLLFTINNYKNKMGNFQDALKNHAFPENATVNLKLKFNESGLNSMDHALDLKITSMQMESGASFRYINQVDNMQIKVIKPSVSSFGKKFIAKYGGKPPFNPYKSVFTQADFPKLNNLLNTAKETFENDSDYSDYRKFSMNNVSRKMASQIGQIFITQVKTKNDPNKSGFNFTVPILLPSKDTFIEAYEYYQELVNLAKEGKSKNADEKYKKDFLNISVTLSNIKKQNSGSVISGNVMVKNLSIGKLYFVTVPLPTIPSDIPEKNTDCEGGSFETEYRNFKFNKNKMESGEINQMLKEFGDEMLAKMRDECRFKLKIKGYGAASDVSTTFQSEEFGKGNEALAKTRAKEIAKRAIDHLTTRFKNFIEQGYLTIENFDEETMKITSVPIAAMPKNYNGNEGFSGKWVTGDKYYRSSDTSEEGLAFREKWRQEGELEGGGTGYFLTPEAKRNFRQWQITMLRAQYVNPDEDFDL